MPRREDSLQAMVRHTKDAAQEEVAALKKMCNMASKYALQSYFKCNSQAMIRTAMMSLCVMYSFVLTSMSMEKFQPIM